MISLAIECYDIHSNILFTHGIEFMKGAANADRNATTTIAEPAFTLENFRLSRMKTCPNFGT